MSVQALSDTLGVIEIILGIMIALRAFAPMISTIGSRLSIIIFLNYVELHLKYPGWEPTLGFPALSVVPGQFNLKDIVLLRVAVLTAGEAWKAASPSMREGVLV